jgi:hypothetical protein
MRVALLCREMKWTYQQYLEQPTFFVEHLAAMLTAEGNVARKRSGAVQ